MKAVIDEDLPRSFTKILSSLGFIILDIRDCGLRGKTDEEVFHFAQKNKAVLFSADLGFANNIDFSPMSIMGIVVLRFPNEMTVKAINNEAKRLLSKLKPENYLGNLIILSPAKIRLRSFQQD